MTKNSYSYAPAIVCDIHQIVFPKTGVEFIPTVLDASELSLFYFFPDPKYNESNRRNTLLL